MAGLLDDTVVIWTTDHGDGLPRAKRSIYDSGLRVPFIVRLPNRDRAGTVDARLVSFVDLAPTLLGLAGAPVPPHLHGQDFLKEAVPQRRYVYAARDRLDELPDRSRAVRDARFKYIRNYLPERPLLGAALLPGKPCRHGGAAAAAWRTGAAPRLGAVSRAVPSG